MARKLANAAANAASTLRQQRLESHGSAQPDERRSQQRRKAPASRSRPRSEASNASQAPAKRSYPEKPALEVASSAVAPRTITADPVAIRLRSARAPDRISSLGRQAGGLTWAVTRRGTDSDSKSVCVFICTEEQD